MAQTAHGDTGNRIDIGVALIIPHAAARALGQGQGSGAVSVH